MLGRQVTAALRRPLQARLRATAAPTQYSLCIRAFSHAPRLLDPTGRPKKAVGEPSRPVKRAVKKAAKESATADSDAAAAKIAKKEAAAKKKEKEAAAKKKAAAAAKKRAKPALTPEQVEKKQQALQKADIKELKKAALEPPSVHPANAYIAFMKEKGGELRERLAGESQNTSGIIASSLSEHSKAVSAAWKNISSSELEHYNHLAHTAKDASLAEYKRWVESHDIKEIKVANLARAKLRRRLETRGWAVIKDERHVKRPLGPYLQFFISRHGSPDFKHILLAERARLVGQEWRALSDEEKKKYIDLAARDLERYVSEQSS